MMKSQECLEVLARLLPDQIVVATYRAAFEWMAVRPSDLNYLSVGAMGLASSHGLGLALGRPDRQIIVLDGDGSLLMNLGSLVTIANKAPKNLVHFVMDNGVYATTGGQDVPGVGVADYADLAKSAGYAHTYKFDNLEDFVTQAEEILSQDGPTFVAAKVIPDIRLPEERAAGRTRRTPEAVIDLLEEFATAR